VKFWTARNLRAITGGQWLRKPALPNDDEPLCDAVSTDTRAIKPGQAFIALKGDRFDAHDFLDSAAGAGASPLIVSDADKIPPALLKSEVGPAILRVPDTLKALGQLAAAYRKTLEGTRVIAVVGSNGKTTTVRLIHALLSSKWRGTSSQKSFNNEVGVPLTILAARPGDFFLICEVGSNHPGETARLTRIVNPDIAVVTSIGRDHIEFFVTVEAIAREHAAIFADIRPGGAAIVPQDLITTKESASLPALGGMGLQPVSTPSTASDTKPAKHQSPSFADLLRPVPNILTFGTHPDASLRITSTAHEASAAGDLRLRLTINQRSDFTIPLVGKHNALNAAAAIAVGRRLGLDDAAAAAGLAAAIPADMRLNQRTIAGISLLIDCYNANPESVIAAARTLADVASDAPRRVFILGDMLEMGTHSDELHREVGSAIARHAAPDLLITVGLAARLASESAREVSPRLRAVHFNDLEQPRADEAAGLLKPGDTALLKASRGMKLERIVQALERRTAPATTISISPSARSIAN
jgi:UDP-N-acetylmuramoyl-tripeptide--D-alanyl-D-alanine ligase